jgi:hypothetical protein
MQFPLLAHAKGGMYLRTPTEGAGGFRKAEIDEKDAFKRWHEHLIEADGSLWSRPWRIKEHIE